MWGFSAGCLLLVHARKFGRPVRSCQQTCRPTTPCPARGAFCFRPHRSCTTRPCACPPPDVAAPIARRLRHAQEAQPAEVLPAGGPSTAGRVGLEVEVHPRGATGQAERKLVAGTRESPALQQRSGLPGPAAGDGLDALIVLGGRGLGRRDPAVCADGTRGARGLGLGQAVVVVCGERSKSTVVAGSQCFAVVFLFLRDAPARCSGMGAGTTDAVQTTHFAACSSSADGIWNTRGLSVVDLLAPSRRFALCPGSLSVLPRLCLSG